MKRFLTIGVPVLVALLGAFLLVDGVFIHGGSATGRVISVVSNGKHCSQTVAYQAGGHSYTTTIQTNERYSSNPAADCMATVGDAVGVRYARSDPARVQQGGTTATYILGSLFLFGGLAAGLGLNGGSAWVGRQYAARRSTTNLPHPPSSSVLTVDEVEQMRTRADRLEHPPEIGS